MNITHSHRNGNIRHSIRMFFPFSTSTILHRIFFLLLLLSLSWNVCILRSMSFSERRRRRRRPIGHAHVRTKDIGNTIWKMIPSVAATTTTSTKTVLFKCFGHFFWLRASIARSHCTQKRMIKLVGNKATTTRSHLLGKWNCFSFLSCVLILKFYFSAHWFGRLAVVVQCAVSDRMYAVR